LTADPKAAVEAVFRKEGGRIIATLIRIARSFDRAEEAMQDAFAAALASWPEKGIPDNPVAWITAAAHRKLIDYSRRERTKLEKQESLRYETPAAVFPADWSVDAPMHFPDDRMRLIFTCCHPALSREAQVALTLRTLAEHGRNCAGISGSGGDAGAAASEGETEDLRSRNPLRSASARPTGGTPQPGAGRTLPDF